MIVIQGAGHYFHTVRAGESFPSLEERLRSRFEWGLMIDIQPPEVPIKKQQ